MPIAHISDFHVFARAPETSLVRADAADAARKVAEDIATHAPGVDAVMFTGALTDGGSAEDYALLLDILAPIKVPVFVVPGNQDKRAALRATFANTLPFGDGPSLNYEAAIGDIRILALDSLVEERVAGRLDPEQLGWFKQRLAAGGGQPTLVLMHHPAFPSAIPTLDRMAVRKGREEFSSIVAGHRGPLRILAGHIHRPFQSLWNGAFCAVAGSPAFQHKLDLRADADEPGAVAEPYANFLHKLDESL
jgi:3',5'-cyclic AMP phosphodiesterase CpdA